MKQLRSCVLVMFGSSFTGSAAPRRVARAEIRRSTSQRAGHPVTEAEAVEMLTNVRNVALALAAAEDGEPKP
jgi:hypothetical protein